MTEILATGILSLTALRVIAWAGLIAGVLDLSCTLTLLRLKGIAPKQVLQMIASGLLGPASFKGGGVTAILGAALHFFIALVAAATYYIASRKLGALIEHAVLCGILYGIIVHLFMSLVVVPLSRTNRPFSAAAFVTQLFVHMFFVGLPIALVVRHFA